MRGFTLTVILFAKLTYGQDKGDVGILVSSDQTMRIALEYRTAQNKQFRWRAAFASGEVFQTDPLFYSRRDIISASDSLIVYQYKGNRSTHQTLRLGLERQFKTSIFSAFADLTLGYQGTTRTRRNSPFVLTEFGWMSGLYTESEDEEDLYNVSPIGAVTPRVLGYSNYQSFRQHFLVAGLRLGINMDLPIKKAFILHTGVACNINTPIYMGTSKIYDFPGNLVLLTPPSIINISTSAEIGLRYTIGSFKNRTRRVKG